MAHSSPLRGSTGRCQELTSSLRLGQNCGRRWCRMQRLQRQKVACLLKAKDLGHYRRRVESVDGPWCSHDIDYFIGETTRVSAFGLRSCRGTFFFEEGRLVSQRQVEQQLVQDGHIIPNRRCGDKRLLGRIIRDIRNQRMGRPGWSCYSRAGGPLAVSSRNYAAVVAACVMRVQLHIPTEAGLATTVTSWARG